MKKNIIIKKVNNKSDVCLLCNNGNEAEQLWSIKLGNNILILCGFCCGNLGYKLIHETD